MRLGSHTDGFEETLAFLKEKDHCDETVQVVVPADSNRSRNIDAAADLAERIYQETQFAVELALRADGDQWLPLTAGDIIEPSSPHWDATIEALKELEIEFRGKTHLAALNGLAPEIRVMLAFQTPGTSYTETRDSIVEAAGINHLIFVSHNYAHQSRVAFAVRNTLAANAGPSGLRSVSVMRHSENPLPDNTRKEIASWCVDRAIHLARGHEGVMASSRGGHRRERLKSWVLRRPFELDFPG